MELRRWTAALPGPSRLPALGALGAALVILGLAVHVVLSVLERPRLAVRLEVVDGAPPVVTSVPEGGGAALAGVAPGDTLLAVGELEAPVAGGYSRLREYLLDVSDRYVAGDAVAWRVARGGQRRVLRSTLVPDGHARAMVVSHSVVFGAFWLLAFFLLYARHEERQTRHLAYTILALTAGQFLRSYTGPVDGGVGLAVEQARALGRFLGPALVVHFGVLFPVESVSRRARRRILLGAYGAWFLFYLENQAQVLRALLSPEIDHAFPFALLLDWHIEQVAYALFAGAFLASGLLMVHTYRRVSDDAVRNRVKWVVWSVVSAAALDLFVTGVGFWAEGPGAWYAWEPYRALLYLLPAAGLLVAVFRHDLFDVDRVIRQSAIYFSTSGVLFVLFAATEGLLSHLLSRFVPGRSQVAGTAGGAALAGALFQPVRRAVQAKVLEWLPVPEEVR